MKKLITLLMVLLAGTYLFAQIPNGGMEDWTKGSVAGTVYYDPTGWITGNSFTATIGLVSVSKDSTDVHGGKYAALLTTQSIPIIGGIPAFIALGQLSNETIIGGIP